MEKLSSTKLVPGAKKGWKLLFQVIQLDIVFGFKYNSMDCIVHGVAKSQIRLNNSSFHKP